jgi:hypothetical protein
MVLLFFTCGASRASAQQCPVASSAGPDIPSRVRTLDGRLIYHEGIRQWFELRLDKAVCGKKSIQLVRSEDSWRPLEISRGCRIKSSGQIDNSMTGYYSRDLYQDVQKVERVGSCVRQEPLRDYTGIQPKADVRSYAVDMHVNYRPGDHPIIFRVRSGGKELRPWQAYASYQLTGGYVLYGLCGRGFVVDRVYGTPGARPSHSDDPRTPQDMASFDPETAATSGKVDLQLGYTCVRERPAKPWGRRTNFDS